MNVTRNRIQRQPSISIHLKLACAGLDLRQEIYNLFNVKAEHILPITW